MAEFLAFVGKDRHRAQTYAPTSRAAQAELGGEFTGRRLQSVGPVGEYTVSIIEVDAARPALAHGFLQREAAERLADAIGELALPVRIQQQQSRRRVSQGGTAAFFALAQF